MTRPTGRPVYACRHKRPPCSSLGLLQGICVLRRVAPALATVPSQYELPSEFLLHGLDVLAEPSEFSGQHSQFDITEMGLEKMPCPRFV